MTGRSLGTFGTDKPDREDHFDYFGQQIRIHPNLTDLAMIRLFRDVSKLELPQPDSEEFIKALSELLPAVEKKITFAIHPDDVDTFFTLAEKHNQDVMDLMEVMQGLLAAVSEHPTGRPSVSSRGRPTTKPRSAASSSSPVKRRLEKQGRPDLALMVLEREEAARSA